MCANIGFSPPLQTFSFFFNIPSTPPEQEPQAPPDPVRKSIGGPRFPPLPRKPLFRTKYRFHGWLLPFCVLSLPATTAVRHPMEKYNILAPLLLTLRPVSQPESEAPSPSSPNEPNKRLLLLARTLRRRDDLSRSSSSSSRHVALTANGVAARRDFGRPEDFFAGILLIGIIDRLVPSVENPTGQRRGRNGPQSPQSRNSCAWGCYGPRHRHPQLPREASPPSPRLVDNITSASPSPVPSPSTTFRRHRQGLDPHLLRHGRPRQLSGSLAPLAGRTVGALLSYRAFDALHVRNAHGMHHSPEWPESCVFISIVELLPAAREYGEAHTSRSHGVVAGMAPDGPSASPAPNKAAPIAKCILLILGLSASIHPR